MEARKYIIKFYKYEFETEVVAYTYSGLLDKVSMLNPDVNNYVFKVELKDEERPEDSHSRDEG